MSRKLRGAIAKNAIPSSADIIKATKLLNPGDVEILKIWDRDSLTDGLILPCKL